jgi:hypothetical protein
MPQIPISQIYSKLPNSTLKYLSLVTLGLILTLTILSTINPFPFTFGVAHEDGVNTIVTKRDFFKPTITFLYSKEPCTAKAQANTEGGADFIFVILHPVRTPIGLYYQDPRKSIEGQADCIYYQEFLKVVQTKDLSLANENPDKDKFKVNNLRTSLQESLAVPEADRYNDPAQNPSRIGSENVEDFKKLKVGMNFEEVKAIIGLSDISYGGTGITKTDGEGSYAIRKNGVKFVAVGWNWYPSSPNAQLIKATIVYDDRRSEEIPLETIRPIKYINGDAFVAERDKAIKDKYYILEQNPNNKGLENVDDFKKLKIGMDYKDVLPIIGQSDRYSKSNDVTNGFEEDNFKIGKNGVNFVAVLWTNEFVPESITSTTQLYKVKIIYDDNRSEELPLETLKPFKYLNEGYIRDEEKSLKLEKEFYFTKPKQ